MSGHLLSHSNSFGFEMEKDTAGCRAYIRNFIVGDEYFKVKYPEHNLVRAHAQMKLLEEFEAKYDEMQAYVCGLLK